MKGVWRQSEFLVCAPTSVTPEVKMHPYSHVVRVGKVVNRRLAVSEDSGIRSRMISSIDQEKVFK